MSKTDETTLPEDLQRCVEFHGHLCPGLVMGYLATKAGLDALRVGRAEDEELIAIVENDSCAVDAVQFLAGCTFGKGNLFFRDYGKQAYTFALRNSGEAVRVSLVPGAFDKGRQSLETREARIRWMLQQPPEQCFETKQVKIDVPPEAEIHKSMFCEQCGERVMETRTRRVDGKVLCIPCSESVKPEFGRAQHE